VKDLSDDGPPGSVVSLLQRTADAQIVRFNERLAAVHADLLAYADDRAGDVAEQLAALTKKIGERALGTKEKLANLAALLDGYQERWKQLVVHHAPAEVFAERGYTPAEFAGEIRENVLPLLERRPEVPEKEAAAVTEGAVKWIEFCLMELAGQGTFEDSDAFYEKVKKGVKDAGTPKQYRLIELLLRAIDVETALARSQYRSSIRSLRQ
jgi:hypothetical protein